MRISHQLLRLAHRNPSTTNVHLRRRTPTPPPWSCSGTTFFSTSAPVKPSERVSSIVNEISGLTLLEAADLSEILRKRFGVEEMPVMAVMAPGTGIGGGGAIGDGAEAAKIEEKPEKTAFDLKLESFDAASKIKVIKEVRSFTDLGLKEAKDLVEKAPAVLKKGVLKEEAEKIVEKMKELGAKVVLE